MSLHLKRLLIAASVLILTVISGITVLGKNDDSVEKRELMTGAWVHRDFYYTFTDSVMTAIKVAGEPKGYKMFRYTMDRIGGHDILRFGRDLSDTSDNTIMIVGEVTDSTAVFAFPTPFVRADSSRGLLGTWKYAKDLISITLTFTPGTMTYREEQIDTETGIPNILEERQGRYTAGAGKNTGKFYVLFEDSTRTSITPVIVDNLMYMFDLSPRKSVFLRAEKAPSFTEYKKALGE